MGPQHLSLPSGSLPAGRWRFAVLALALVASTAVMSPGAAAQTQDADWPPHYSNWYFEIVKDPDALPEPFEPWDDDWLHFHRNHMSVPDATVNVIKPRVWRNFGEGPASPLALEVRYTVRGVPVSGWLSSPYEFRLEIDNPGLDQISDGVHDLTIEARGADRDLVQPVSAFIHLTREMGATYGYDRSVPILTTLQQNQLPNDNPNPGPSIVYVEPEERNFVGYPVDPSAGPWNEPIGQADLYQELMAPRTELFGSAQMWWDHPSHPGAPFIRGLTPKHGEDHRFLRVDENHQSFPMKDGPRGVGWMSPFISGAVDSQGRFAFAEAGGRIGYLMPDGEVITIAGWRVKPGMDPVWWEKPLATIRVNMENRGNWTAGRGEFFTPLDVAIDPQNENILYVAAWEDNVIWKVVVPADPRTQEATISILAGDPNHQPGFSDGQGSAARFNGVGSLVFDPVADVLYVADQDNDAIRVVTRSGNVSTLAGQPGMGDRVATAGADRYDQLAARSVSQIETPSGQTPDIYIPQTIRVDSQGRIILLEVGYGSIRRIDPTTLATELLGEVRQKHTQWQRGWAWIDVDRWGNSGPQDGIYWAKFVSNIAGESFNEVFEWLPPNGGESQPVFNVQQTGLWPDGWGSLPNTNPPHYAWLVAVDPRGGVLLSGGGEHGLTRIRARRAGDPNLTTQDEYTYWLGRRVYASGLPDGATGASKSILLKYGWAGHNYLGFTDLWGLEGASDAALLDAFEVPAEVRNDATARAQLLTFLRPNTIGATGTVPVGPTPTATPTPTSTPTPTPTATPVPPVDGELLINGDFSDGDENWWATSGGVTGGEFCAAVPASGSPNDFQMSHGQGLNLVAGTSYTFAFDIRASVSTGSGVNVVVFENDATTYPAVHRTTVTPTTSTQRLRTTFTVPASNNPFGVTFHLGGLANTYCLDNLSVTATGRASVPRIVTLAGRADGWLEVDGTRNWVSALCRSRLVAQGAVVDVVSWPTLAVLADAVPFQGCDRLLDDLFYDGSPRVVTLAGRTDGWVQVDGTRNWVSASCRAQLENSGAVAYVVSWPTLAALIDAVPLQRCDQLLDDLFYDGSPRLVTLAGRTDGWVQVDGTRNWVGASCRAELIAGDHLPEQEVTWPTVAALVDAVPFQRCDALIVALTS